MTIGLDNWWLQSFRRLLNAEVLGFAAPSDLSSRWLALDQHVFPSKQRSRWIVGFRVPEAIAHFLDDADIRAKDPSYAERQWSEALAWLRTMEPAQ